MSDPVAAVADGRRLPPPVAAPACYLYGIVPAAAVAPPAAEPGEQIGLVRHRRIAALVRQTPAQPAQPTRRELLGHARLLDRVAETTPVLPMRFGTVLGSPEAMARELLMPHHDTFAAALAELNGRAQFMVGARYPAEVVLHEVLAEEPAVVRLYQRLRQQAGGPDPIGRLRLGELVARAVAAKRAVDARLLAEALRPHAVASRLVPSRSSGLDGIAEAAMLVELGHRRQFEAAAEQLARHWHGRVRLRLRGPMAAYHFVDGLVDRQMARR
jgi:hypothetical protein